MEPSSTDSGRTLDELLTEQRNPASARIDQLPTVEMLAVINAEDARIAAAVQTQIPSIAEFVNRLAARVRAGGRLFYIGAGTSGRLGVLDAAECPPTFNVAPSLVQGVIAGGESALARATEATEDDPAAGVRDLMERGFSPADSLVGIAASGRTPYVLGAVRQARAMDALTAGISCTPGSELSAAAEIGIELLVGPEVVSGSTRMKAGTATKLALNMISTGLMIRLGMTYGNLMVNVQPKNVKLANRAERIIMEAAGIEREAAARLLGESGGEVKLAVVMARLGAGREEAAKRLAAAGGRIADALNGSSMTSGSWRD